VTDLVTPYGGRLVDLLAPAPRAAELAARAAHLPSLVLPARAACDFELLVTGGFSPLDRFMGERDYRRVVDDMRLAGGTLFPIPVTLPVEPAAGLRLDQEVALREATGRLLAVMTIDEIYPWDRRELALGVFGTDDRSHPLVAELDAWGSLNVSGRIDAVALPHRLDLRELRLTPAQTRAELAARGHARVAAFQTRNPLHRVHEELLRRTAAAIDGALLLHPAVGMTRPGDVDYYARVRTYKAVTARYLPRDRVLLALLPLAMRLAGPREALWHAIIRRNHGASHFIVGRDHASPGVNGAGEPFYPPYAAQELIAVHGPEIGVTPVPFEELAYLPDEDRYEEISRVPPHATVASISGTQVRDEYLARGRRLPGWFSRPEVAEVLAEAYPPRHREGFCVWFTGLSGSGKSTTAEMLAVLLMERGRQVTMLDGDVVRTHLSSGLGFTKADRDVNIRRIGFVASEIVRHGGAVICAAISPYRQTRDECRRMAGAGRFVEVFVDTPLDVCEERDTKGLYGKARRGEITGVTGIDDPYEPPSHPEVTLDTVRHTVDENAHALLDHLVGRGFVRPDDEDHG
jgi:sulfate adenylyltransferase